MTEFSLIWTTFILTVLTSCGQTEEQTTNETGGHKTVSLTPTIKTTLVDYKSDTYKISLGQHYKISDKIIDWRWAGMADDDDKIDSTGKDVFQYLGEPFINYNEEDWLSALYIETDKNLIITFSCSVLFTLEDSASAVDNFLRLLSKDIKQLKNDEVVKSLKTTGYYKIDKVDYVEVFELTKGKEYENDRFQYTITSDKMRKTAANIGLP